VVALRHGTLDRIHHALYVEYRERSGGQPRIIDSQA
jgi:hypothetical protein